MAKSSAPTPGPATGVASEDLGVIVVCAFRYALGRKSYLPSMMADLIIRYWKSIPERDRLRIEVELTRALAENDDALRDLGWDCDVEAWQRLAVDIVGLRKDANGR